MFKNKGVILFITKYKYKANNVYVY